jgi:hypothetical protein
MLVTLLSSHLPPAPVGIGTPYTTIAPEPIYTPTPSMSSGAITRVYIYSQIIITGQMYSRVGGLGMNMNSY